MDEGLGTIRWQKSEYLQRNQAAYATSRAQNSVPCELETLFFTYANVRYEHYVLPYIYSVLYHNKDAAIEICLDSASDFREKNLEAIRILEQSFGENRLILRDVVVAKAQKTRPQSIRNLEVPTLILPYTYIGDVDILVLERDITAQHKRNMELINLPYSNTYRRVDTDVGHRNLLSGLHFTRTDAYYPQIDVSHLNLLELSNQDLIYILAVGKTGLAPPAAASFRPWHGFHMSERLNFYMKDPAGRQFGLNDAKACKAYFEMRATTGWQRLKGHFAPEYRAVLNLMDSALQNLHPEWKFMHSVRPEASKPAIDIIPGPLRAYPYQSYVTGLNDFVKKAGIKTVLDLGCGDPLVTLLGIGAAEFYVGLDDDVELVERNMVAYRNSRYLFKQSDIRIGELPAADLILARDTLNELSVEEVGQVIDRVMRSGAKYLAVTHFVEHGGGPMTVERYNVINWRSAPFGFGAPIIMIKDSAGEIIPDFIGGEPESLPEWATRKDRYLAIWDLENLKSGGWGLPSLRVKSARDCYVLDGPFTKFGDVGWYYILPSNLRVVGDNVKKPTQSRIVLWEGEDPLGPAHTLHADIGSKGCGSYSHWGSTIYFSTSDNSDPNTNERAYSFTFGTLPN